MNRSLVIALVLTLGGCRCNAPTPANERLVVFAAASLREAFTAIGEEFERLHPDVEIAFNFAGTQELRRQLEQGARVDVFASADQRHMRELHGAGLVSDPVVFAYNEPVIIVAPQDTAFIQSIAGLPAAERLVIGVPEVPIGRYTLRVLERASESLGPSFADNVQARVVSREFNVRQVLMKVSLGEAQAGFVYRTDLAVAGEGVRVVAIPPETNVLAEYPIAVVVEAPHPLPARAWVDLVLSSAGRKALQDALFRVPEP